MTGDGYAVGNGHTVSGPYSAAVGLGTVDQTLDLGRQTDGLDAGRGGDEWPRILGLGDRFGAALEPPPAATDSGGDEDEDDEDAHAGLLETARPAGCQ